MNEKFEPLGVADREVVIEGMNWLKDAYEKFIDHKGELTYVDGLMIGHNFYKLMLYDLARRADIDKNIIVVVAIDTLRKLIEEKPATNENDPTLT